MVLDSGNRYVAFFDLIGFKSWVEHVGSKEVFIFLRDHIFMSIRASFPGAIVDKYGFVTSDYSDIGFVNFSDSILFYTKDDSVELFEILIKITSEFMNSIICGQSRMVKGSIAHGEFYVDPDSNSYVGKALIDAYLDEEGFDWLALGLHETVLHTDSFVKFDKQNGFLLKQSIVPLKNSKIYPLCVNWAHNNLISDILYNPYTSLETCLNRKVEEIKNITKESDNKEAELIKVRKRIQNTVDFLDLFGRENNTRTTITFNSI